MTGESRNVVIIGGGITGLTAAFYLQEAIKKHNLPIEFKLIEASRRLGGKIQTVRRDGFVIERGPDSFLASKQSASRLAKNVGLKDDLVSNTTGKSYVLVNDKLHSIPEGLNMGIPTKFAPFMITNLFSFTGKFRATADLVLPRSKNTNDQSLGAFFRRRFGDEVVENLIEPLLSGIYAGDIDQQSLMSTFPEVYEAEKKYRSLLVGLKKTLIKPSEEEQNNIKSGGLLTLKNGLESLVGAIEGKLSSDSVIKGIRVESIKKHPNHGDYTILLNNGEHLNADSILVSLPHYHLPTIFSDFSFVEPFRKIPATSVATVNLAFSEEAITRNIDSHGFLVSRNSDYTITTCSWTHNKWPNSTPKGKVLLRCLIGRTGDEAVVDFSDAEIEQIVLSDLNRTIGITMKPEFTVVSRWKNAMPHYTVGHQDRVNKMNENIKKDLPGIFISGSSFGGISVPDCIDQGEKAVQDVLQFLRQ